MADRPRGTGLGLAISRQIIEHFGGRIWVDDKTVAGACLAFQIPALALGRESLPSSSLNVQSAE